MNINMQKTVETWHSDMIEKFEEVGVCYRNEFIPLNPYILPSALAKQLEHDLHNIINIIRKMVLQSFSEKINNVRKDYAEIIGLYKNKPRIPAIMRPDGIMVNQQLKLIEINIDSSIGGIWEMDYLQSIFKNNPLLKEHSDYNIPNPKEAFLNYLKDIIAIMPNRKNLNLVMDHR